MIVVHTAAGSLSSSLALQNGVMFKYILALALLDNEDADDTEIIEAEATVPTETTSKL